MGSEIEKQHEPGLPVENKDESQKKSKISYSRDFLLSFSELDICKRVPAGFDASILSEFGDASYIIPEWQKSSGGLSLQSSRYGSSPPNRADSLQSSYSRGSHGRWDTRSSGSNDRDGDSQSDRDSVTQDTGKRYGNQSRRSWQNPEHDGLLGSGAFPRPSGYAGGTLAPKARGNDNFLLNRSNEPYHPPRPYKALPHSRRDFSDSINDETFGSAECSSQDRAEEERKRRASFELMRKEQHKALQEKLKHPDKHKEQLNTGIGAFLENSDDGKSLWSKNDDKLEDDVTPVSQSDSGKHAFPTPAPASRPLVPPGFATAILEKNLGAKSLVPTPGLEVGNIGFEDDVTHTGHAKHSLVGNGPGSDRENEKPLSVSVPSHKQEDEIQTVCVPSMSANEKTVIPSSGFEVSDCSFGSENPSSRTSSLQEARESWVDSAVTDFDAEKVTRCGIAGTVDQDHSATILDKLFGNALAVNGVGSPSFVEHHDSKPDEDTWSTVPSQASKFAHWFQEEKKPVDGHSSSTARDLLSLIVSNEKGGAQVSVGSDEKAIEHFQTIFPSENIEVSQNLITSSSTSPTLGIPESLYQHGKPDTSLGVLTCEDLEQSILAEVKESSAHLHSMEVPWSVSDAKVELQKANVDDLASQHLLSLLQKGTSLKEPTSSPFFDMESSNTLGVPGITGMADGASAGSAENIHNTEKTLTLEALFGKAFMNELQSVGAPVSAHRGSVGGGIRNDVSEPHGLSFPIADDGFFRSTVEYASSKPGHEGNSLASNQPQETLSDRLQGHWLGFDDPRTNGSKLGAVIGFDDRADEAVDFQLPEGDLLNDPVNHETSMFMPVGAAAKREEFISSEAPIDIADKLAALNSLMNEERPVTSLDNPPIYRGAYNPVESELPYQHLHGRPSSPQFPHQMNHTRPSFHSLDHHTQRNPQMSFIGPESIHHDPQHAFPPNIFHHPFHGPGAPRFDPARHSLPQHIPPMPGNFPPPHLLQGLPRGVPLSHPMNHMPGYMPELTPMQGFPLNHRQPNYGGLGTAMPGPVGDGGNHLEVLERLMEMELRANSKQMPPAAAGHGPGIYGPELDMAFRYR
ncbi:uncharacterized protein LOC131249108 [Magnolia sinica]|uniref:uncharacterized protein LOC131249108 n=1 Tax=Magnolia sinica TaxID=86752 RepID=UPI002658A165|nr:uncharacterized protein LOC131249108 [Magnolia sinica]XP_058105657.1 uncharacterized protein LOC131249108 [Magnolia sinica]